ncbi:MAG: DNA cytosine methyltransferase [Caulobacter sp.]|nr:DNA cytosine methyltransferase [Caulobacter sp.]
MEGTLRSISLFTGAGGLDLGFEARGFHPIACFENDLDSRSTLIANRPNWLLPGTGDIEELKPSQLMADLNLKAGDLDLILGGPPCQPFSKSAYWARSSFEPIDDARTRPLLKLNRLIETALPKAIVLENVGVVAKEGDGVLKFYQRTLDRINRLSGTKYLAQLVSLNAADYGVPQLRERAFVVALRDGQTFVVPPALNSAGERRTAWDAFGDLFLSQTERGELQMRGKWADLLPSIPEGLNYLHHTSRGGGTPLFGWRTRYWSFLLKLAKDKPAWTIQASPGPSTGPFHWENRLLSVMEMKRLQTFPDNYVLKGSYASQRRQLGNAVPSALAEAIAGQLREALGLGAAASATTFARTRRDDCPAPEAVMPVPSAYMSLVAEHAEHPGTGLGPGAQRRTAGLKPRVTEHGPSFRSR